MGLPYGASLVFVCISPGPALLARLAGLRRAGHPVALLHTDGVAEGLAARYGVECHRVGLKGEGQ